MAIALTLTPEELKVVWTAVQQYVDNQPEVDDPADEDPLMAHAEPLRQRLDGMFLDVAMSQEVP